MSNKTINVRAIVAQKRALIKEQVLTLQKNNQIQPTLRVVHVGEHPASISYIKAKLKAAAEVGIAAEVLHYPATITETELLQVVEQLNEDQNVHGYLVQLPLPVHIDEGKILQHIVFEKDIDGFHPENLGRLMLGMPGFVPCTPKGIMEILQEIDVPLAGKHVVIVGRSNIVGKPVAMLALQKDATVMLCHSQTIDLPKITKQADILIVAIGRANFITKEYIKEGAIVIDVGVNRLPTTGKLVGDVDFTSVMDIVGAITPVPGGVGPMTVTMLLQNVVEAVKQYAVK